MEIRFDDVSYGYSADAPVLHHIDYGLDGSGLVCIIGPNGVGKSTMIRCINKLLKPTNGAVYVDGHDVEGFKLKEMAQLIGYVPASNTDTFSMTVLDTILMGRHPHQKVHATREDLHVAYEVMKRMNILHLAMRNFDELSAGQHQKVAIARGLAQQPRVLILDEPTSNLDIRHQMQTIDILRSLAAEDDVLVIMISHDLNLASMYADRIIVMSTPGIIYKIGSPEEVITKEMIRYVYGVESEIVMHAGRPHVILDSYLSNRDVRMLHGDESVVPEHLKRDLFEEGTGRTPMPIWHVHLPLVRLARNQSRSSMDLSASSFDFNRLLLAYLMNLWHDQYRTSS